MRREPSITGIRLLEKCLSACTGQVLNTPDAPIARDHRSLARYRVAKSLGLLALVGEIRDTKCVLTRTYMLERPLWSVLVAQSKGSERCVWIAFRESPWSPAAETESSQPVLSTSLDKTVDSSRSHRTRFQEDHESLRLVLLDQRTVSWTCRLALNGSVIGMHCRLTFERIHTQEKGTVAAATPTSVT